ncbi:MAG: AAA family ATPase [Actinomycetota bacterium]
MSEARARDQLTMPGAARRRPLLVAGIALVVAVAGAVLASLGGGAYTATATIILQDPQADSAAAVIGLSPDRFVNGQVAVFDLDEHHELAADLANAELARTLAEGSGDVTSIGEPATITVGVTGSIGLGSADADEIRLEASGAVAVPGVAGSPVVDDAGNLSRAGAPVLDDLGNPVSVRDSDQLVVRSDGLVVVVRSGLGPVVVAPDGSLLEPEGAEPEQQLSTDTTEAETDTETEPEAADAVPGVELDDDGTVRLTSADLRVEIAGDGRAVLYGNDDLPVRRPDDNRIVGPDARRIVLAGSDAVLVGPDTVVVEGATGIAVLDTLAQVVAANPVIEVDPAPSPLAEATTLTADQIDEQLVVTARPETFVLSVRFEAATEELALAGANGSVDAFTSLQQDAAVGENSAAIARAEEAIGDLVDQLVEVEARITSLRAVAGGDSQLDQQYETILEEIAEVGESLINDRANSDAEVDRIQDLLIQLGAIEQIGRIELQQPAIADAIETRAQIRARIDQLESQRDLLVVGTADASAGIALLSPARDADVAGGLGTLRLAIVGLVLGAIVGTALAYVLEVRSPQRIEAPIEVERLLGAPLMAEIPDYRHEEISGLVAVLDQPQSHVAEAYRISAAALSIAARTKKVKVVGFVSAASGAGKTAVVSNLAVALAQSNRKVLALDSDLEGRALGGLLRLAGGHQGEEIPGIANILRAELTFGEAIDTVDLPGDVRLDVITAGTNTTSARLAVGADLWTRLFSEARRANYDVVLVDVAPLLSVAYASRVLQELQGVIVVVPNGAKLEELSDLNDRLNFSSAPVLGFLVNRTRIRRERTASIALSQLQIDEEPRPGWFRRVVDGLSPRSEPSASAPPHPNGNGTSGRAPHHGATTIEIEDDTPR